MSSRRFLTALVTAVWVCSLSQAGDETPDGSFARVEVRGKLETWRFNYLERDRYAVTFGRNEDKQVFVLNLPDEATRKAARELVGQTVVVAGDIGQMKKGDGKRNQAVVTVMVVSVKTLKKADPLPPK